MSDEDSKKEWKPTRMQSAFMDAYLAGPTKFKATASAIEAGYSEKTAYSIGWTLLRNVEIKAEIERRLDEVRMSKAETLAGIADIARGDVAEFMEIGSMGWSLSLLLHDENGELILDPATNKAIRNPKTKLIKKLRQKVTTINGKDGDDKEIIETEIELYSAADALVTMAKHHGLLKDTVEHTGKDGGPVEQKVTIVEIIKTYEMRPNDEPAQ